MQTTLETLILTESTLEKLSGLAINDILVFHLFYLPSERQDSQIITLCLREVQILALSLLFSLPITWLVVKTESFWLNGIITISISLAVLISLNFYWRVQLRKFRVAVKLWQAAKRYNEIIQALIVLEQVRSVTKEEKSLTTTGVLEILNTTRNSLICALKTERILRENQKLVLHHTELLENLASNQTLLLTSEVMTQAAEYERLVTAAIEIGTSVYQEISSLQRGEA